MPSGSECDCVYCRYPEDIEDDGEYDSDAALEDREP